MDDPQDDGPVHPAALDFEQFLWELALRFVGVPGDGVDAEIRNALRQISQTLHLDRASFWQIPPDAPDDFAVTHIYDAVAPATSIDETDGSISSPAGRLFVLGGAPAYPSDERARSRFPWITQRMFRGLTTVIRSPDDLPPEAARDREGLLRIATKSTVIVPLRTTDGVVGGMTFAAVRRQFLCSDWLVRRFELVADVFSRALNAKRAAQIERASAERLALAAASAGAGLWEADLATGVLHATREARRLYGLPEDGPIDIGRVLDAVHPDDRFIVRERVAWAREHTDSYSQEYRVVLGDGTVRWINTRGRPFESVPGKGPDRLFGASIDVTERRLNEIKLQEGLDETRRLRDRLQHEVVYLRSERKGSAGVAKVVGHSQAMRRVIDLVQQVAPTNATVLLLGDTGTGKGRLADAIHDLSPRRTRPMVRVNCTAIPPTLIESELFGREKGAYTGALTKQVGRFELAHDSTIFLDEIGDLPLDIQVKLLRVLDERTIERLGSPRTVSVDVRVIAATNQDLDAAVKERRFREDLYYRLNVFPIYVPPLRERTEDIPILVRALVDELNVTMGRRIDTIPCATIDALTRRAWPGNVRELRNIIERAMITSVGSVLDLGSADTDVDQVAPQAVPPGQALKDVERAHVLTVLQQTGWRIRGPYGAAAVLGLPPTTLENRMKRLGITRPGRPGPS